MAKYPYLCREISNELAISLITKRKGLLWQNGFVKCVVIHMKEMKLLISAHNVVHQKCSFIKKEMAAADALSVYWQSLW